ncbi:hypothetical protein [Streptomyces coelicoflavus]|uniref:hypothetical protein n=1 Tax=Streptomyces coelicoflavus TaxID=285562 RepID=UPI002E26F21F
MADPLYPLAPDEDLPELGTYNAIGTMLLRNSRADASGGFFATCWFMLILPVVPLGRYYVRQTGFSDESGLVSIRTTTSYEIVGRSRVRWTEVVRTCLFWWIVTPAAFLVPSIFAAVGWEDDNAGLYGMSVSVGLVSLLFTLLFFYGKYWRRVSEVFPVKFSVLKPGRVVARRSVVLEGLAGRLPNTSACQAAAYSAGDSGCGQRPMSASHWLLVRGVTPSNFWAEVSGVIERPGMALIAW